MIRELNILVAGVGGQGSVLLSRIISSAAVREGLRTIVSEAKGGAQRGGTVVSHIRIGAEVYSPIVPYNRGDILLGLEPIEALRVASTYLKENGLIILNTNPTPPVLVQIGSREYPSTESIIRILKKITKRIILIQAADIAEKAGDRMTTNIVMLGALTATKAFPVPEKTVLETLINEIPQWARDINLRAFNLGLEAVKFGLKEG